MARTPIKRPAAAPATTRLAELGGATEPDTGAAAPADNPGDDLQAMMAELAGSSSSSVTVYRSNKGQQLAYVFKCTPDAFSLDTLRDKYNGGEFRLFITREGVLWKNKTVYVEPKQASGDVPAPTQAAELAAVMRDGFTKQAELLTATLRTLAAAPPPPPPPSLFANLDLPAAITALSALLTTLRPPAPPPMPAMDTGKSIDLLMKGFELARELKSEAGSEGEPSMLGILRDLIKSPMLAQAVTAAAQGQQPQARPVPAARPQIPQAAPPQVPPVPAAPVPQQSFASETPQMNTMLTQYLHILCAKAAEGSDPALYADLVLDSLDEQTLQQLLNRPPTPVDALIADYAPVAQHREWFEQLVAIIVEALAPEPAPVAQLGGNDAGPSDASGHSTPTIPG